MEYVLGIDIGGTNTKIGILTHDGELLSTARFPTQEAEDFNGFCLQLKATCDELINKKNLTIKGIGVGAPDVDCKSGDIVSPPNLKWGTVPLKKSINDIFPDMAVYVENDANTAAIGEKVWGQAKGFRNFCTITLGTGIGTGVFIHNKLVHETEGGHIKISIGGRECSCGKTGHFEAYASVRGIKLTAKDMTGKDYSFSELIKAYSNNDTEAVEVFNKTADYLARGLATMGNMICFEAFILAGGIAMAGEPFRQVVEKKLNNNLFNNHSGKIKLLISDIATEHGSVAGAASLVYYNLHELAL